MAVTVTINPVKLAAYIRSPDGPTVRYMIRLGTQVRDRARQLVGVSRGTHLAPTLERATENPGGHLRDSIVTRLVFEGALFRVLVGSPLPYARYHHDGTPPHVIRARHGRVLRFFWPELPGVAYFPKVTHPGTRPNPFLIQALREVLR